MEVMKTLLFLLIFSTNCQKYCQGNVSSNSVSTSAFNLAFKAITSKVLESNGYVTIINFSEDSKVISSLDGTIPYQLSRMNRNFDKFYLEISAIITFDTVDSFKSFNDKAILKNSFPKSFQFFIYCIDSRSIEQQLKLVKDTTILRFLYFVVEEKDQISLMTFVWFTPRQCNLPQLVTINKFNKKSKIWNDNVFEIEKFSNLEGCPLVFGIPSQGMAARCDVRRGGSMKCEGYNVQIVKDLSKSMNFLFKFNPLRSGNYLYENLPVELLVQQSLTSSLRPKTVTTLPYVFQDYRIAVSPSEEYSAYEKLLLPFDHSTWVMITATFSAAFLTIAILNLTGKKFRELVFGENVKTPTLNVAAIFFGISQLKLPTKSFARVLVMIFFLYTMIIRTVWQSKNFDFCQRSISKPNVKTIGQMIQKNYSLYLPDAIIFRTMTLPGM